MKIHGSRHHVHPLEHAERHERIHNQTRAADAAQVAKSPFQADVFETSPLTPSQSTQATTASATGAATGAADPVSQLIGALMGLIEQLKALMNRAPVPPATSTTPAQGTPLPTEAGTVPGTTPGAATPSAEEQFRKLIAADVKAARGSEATQADYDYWLPKLMGPNDSGFVTSGQMSATEYWHRRMLGWQAGGPDAARFGPYSGDGQEHSAVPPYAQMLA